MDNTIPVIICSVKHMPNMKPMFHMKEIDRGVGNLRRDVFTKSAKGSLLINL